jgi:hypothetical protein
LKELFCFLCVCSYYVTTIAFFLWLQYHNHLATLLVNYRYYKQYVSFTQKNQFEGRRSAKVKQFKDFSHNVSGSQPFLVGQRNLWRHKSSNRRWSGQKITKKWRDVICGRVLTQNLFLLGSIHTSPTSWTHASANWWVSITNSTW